MTKCGKRHMANVFESRLTAAVQQRPDLAADDQRLRAARARSVAQIAFRLWVRFRCGWLCCQNDTYRIVLYRVRNGNGEGCLPEFQDFFRIPNAMDGRLFKV